MKTGLIEFLFFSFLIVLSWFIVVNNTFPILPLWTTPVIAITIGAIAQAIRYVGSLEEKSMKSDILLAIVQSEQRLEQRLKDQISGVEARLGDKIDNLSVRVARLEGKDEARKEPAKVS
jgi:hypothetical protein